MAYVPTPRGSRKHHHPTVAVQITRVEPGGEPLAVHARQLPLQPHVQKLRRHRRSLLPRLEQGRRSAMAHHVYRTQVMDLRVMINGNWYKADAGGVAAHPDR